MPKSGIWWVPRALLSLSLQLTATQMFRERHTILGTIVVVCLAIQPALGLMHHRHYVKTHGRGLISHVHIWWGRILMALGVINGGLGLVLARERDSLKVAYGVVAAITFLVYFLVKAYKTFAAIAQRRNVRIAGASHKDSIMPPPRRPYQEPRAPYQVPRGPYQETRRYREAFF